LSWANASERFNSVVGVLVLFQVLNVLKNNNKVYYLSIKEECILNDVLKVYYSNLRF